MNCPHCSASLVADARFCPACGKATAPTESGSAWPVSGSAPDLVGREIAGRYRITKKLGEGGMGAVYRGEQISLKRSVAVKLLRPELSTNQMILRRFNAEAEAVAKLSHPNTVNIYDFGQDTDGSLFIAMEFIEGRSLREAIQKEGPFPPARALAIALQVAASLSDAHSHSIVHRDLKPDNVMLQDRGRQKDVVRVLDFGIAKLRDDSRATQQAMTQAGDMLGTPQYMAPEQIKGVAIDGRTDVYALGCMIYEMVTGRLPYEAPTVMAMLTKHLMETAVAPSARRPDLGLSPAIDQLVLAAMAKEPHERPATMDQYSEMIAAHFATLPADPNRSAALSIQQGIVTPPALSSFQAPTPPPGGYPPGGFVPTPQGGFTPFASPPPGPPGYAQPQIAPTMPVGAPTTELTRSKSRAPIFIVLGALVLGGAGIGVFLATRDKTPVSVDPDKPVDPNKPDPDDKRDLYDKPDPDDPDPPDPNETEPDPWANEGPAPSRVVAKPAARVAAKTIGTAEMPIPKGAGFDVPNGFTKVTLDAKSLAYADYSRGILIAMGPLIAGTNDVKQLANHWAKSANATFVEADKIKSAGAMRDVAVFTATVENVPVAQVIVTYISPTYRLGVLYQAPALLFANDGFEKEVESFFANRVNLP